MNLSRISSTPAALVVGVLFFLPISCARKDTPPPAPATAVQTARYTVRGMVEETPDPSRKGAAELQIHHESISNFKDKNGKVVGMHAMIMGFPPGPGITTPELKKGDKIELDFEVVWTGKDPWYFTAIRKLPADAVLDFSK